MLLEKILEFILLYFYFACAFSFVLMFVIRVIRYINKKN